MAHEKLPAKTELDITSYELIPVSKLPERLDANKAYITENGDFAVFYNGVLVRDQLNKENSPNFDLLLKKDGKLDLNQLAKPGERVSTSYIDPTLKGKLLTRIKNKLLQDAFLLHWYEKIQALCNALNEVHAQIQSSKYDSFKEELKKIGIFYNSKAEEYVFSTREAVNFKAYSEFVFNPIALEVSLIEKALDTDKQHERNAKLQELYCNQYDFKGHLPEGSNFPTLQQAIEAIKLNSKDKMILKQLAAGSENEEQKSSSEEFLRLMNDYTDANAELASIEQRKENAEKKAAEKQNRIKEAGIANETVIRLQKEKIAREKQLEESVQIWNESQGKVSAQRAKVDSLEKQEAELRAKKRIIPILTGYAEKLRNRAVELKPHEAIIAAESSNITNHTVSFEKLQEEKTNREKRKELTQQRDAVEKQLAQYVQESEKQKEEIERLGQAIVTHEGIIEAKKKELLELNSQKSTLSSEIAGLKSTTQANKTKPADLKEKVSFQIGLIGERFSLNPGLPWSWFRRAGDEKLAIALDAWVTALNKEDADLNTIAVNLQKEFDAFKKENSKRFFFRVESKELSRIQEGIRRACDLLRIAVENNAKIDGENAQALKSLQQNTENLSAVESAIKAAQKESEASAKIVAESKAALSLAKAAQLSAEKNKLALESKPAELQKQLDSLPVAQYSELDDEALDAHIRQEETALNAATEKRESETLALQKLKVGTVEEVESKETSIRSAQANTPVLGATDLPDLGSDLSSTTLLKAQSQLKAKAQVLQQETERFEQEQNFAKNQLDLLEKEHATFTQQKEDAQKAVEECAKEESQALQTRDSLHNQIKAEEAQIGSFEQDISRLSKEIEEQKQVVAEAKSALLAHKAKLEHKAQYGEVLELSFASNRVVSPELSSGTSLSRSSLASRMRSKSSPASLGGDPSAANAEPLTTSQSFVELSTPPSPVTNSKSEGTSWFYSIFSQKTASRATGANVEGKSELAHIARGLGQ